MFNHGYWPNDADYLLGNIVNIATLASQNADHNMITVKVAAEAFYKGQTRARKKGGWCEL
jgi:hypothetical protein